MRLVRVLVLAGLALFLASAARADVADYLGKTVVTVSVQVEGRTITDPRIVGLITTATGRPLGMREVRESITHLFSLGQYEDVEVRAALSGDGVALVYDLVPLHTITGVEFHTLPDAGADADRLRQLLLETYGRVPRANRANDMAGTVAHALNDAGYLQARVTPRVVVEHAPEHATLIFDVTAGERARVSAVSVEGNPGMPAAQLLSMLGVSTGSVYERERLDQRIEKYVEERKRKGYYEARLTVLPTVTADRSSVTLVLDAQQGPVVHVVFAGDPVPADRREELVPVAREGSADEDLLEDSSNRIQDYFRAQGYRDVTAPFRRAQKDDELVVTFDVHKGPQYRVESIDIAGNTSIASDQLVSRLRVRAGQPFSAAALDADLTQLEDEYRRHGFAAAKADATTQLHQGAPDQHVGVSIRIDVTENVQTIVNSVRIEGNATVPASELTGSLGLGPGTPFSVARLALDRDALELRYANLGYESATVETRPGFSADSRQADVVFVVREGPRVYVDRILIVGNERTKTSTIERELQFKPGEPLGLEALSESQRRLAALGLFRRARITQLGRGDESRRDVLVTVEEAPLTTISWGGGFEVRSRVVASPQDPSIATETLEFAPRASFEIGRRNLFGANRSVNLFTSGSLHPRDAPPDNPQQGSYIFPQYSVVLQYRQPRFRNSRADFRVTGVTEQQIRSSFDFSRISAAAELAVRMSKAVIVSGGYQLQRTRVFNQTADPASQPEIDRLFPQVRLSSFVGSVVRDTRDDAIDPGTGRYLSFSGQLAARALGSEVGFLKTYFTAQSFRTLPVLRGAVLAASARLGTAVGFINESGSHDLPASERFFAGGDTTVRGFALDRLGVQHVPRGEYDTLDAGGFPLGGNALLIFNGELRVPVTRNVKVVGFTDVGNVYKVVSKITASDLRPAVGVGFRYKSPVGPLRFDLGFKVPRRLDESRSEWFITFGEAF